jgi:nucleotide-binding universal stress UspA family protein
MPTGVLVATGGSVHSESAITCAAYLADVLDRPLTVVSVVKNEAHRPRAEAVLARAQELVRAAVPGLEADTVVRVGHPAEEIVAEAETGSYRMVVVGEKQHHGLMTRFIMGSTAQRVVEHAPCPVVVAKGHVAPIRRLLICDSGAVRDSIVDRVVAQLPRLLATAEGITVLHVMSQMSAGPGIEGRDLFADAAELMAEHAPEGEVLDYDLDRLTRAGYPSQPKVRHGLVVEEILEEAREGDYQLVIIGPHAGTGWRRVLLDDLSHEIVVEMDRPVLVARGLAAP